jgi:chorismate mutase
MKILLLALMVAITSPLSVAEEADSNKITVSESQASEVFDAINERLAYMRDVAIYKLQNNLAIENSAREAVVLASATEAASEYNLEANSVKQFFNAQIVAAKIIQTKHQQYLRQHNSRPATADLNRIIRPELIRLGNKIIRLISIEVNNYGGFKPEQRQYFLAAINEPYLTEQDKAQLFNALVAINKPTTN